MLNTIPNREHAKHADLVMEFDDYNVWNIRRSGYQMLTDDDGRVITIITEPEDRTFYRDLKPILEELQVCRRCIDQQEEVIKELIRKLKQQE